MSDLLPIAYVGILLAFLAGVAVFVFRQVLKTRRTERLLADLQAKYKEGKGDAKNYYDLAGIYLEKKLYVQAGKVLQKALKTGKVEPENRALIYNSLGYSYCAQDQLDLGIRQYREALKLYPECVSAWNNLGRAYERKSLTVQALEAYEEALKFAPESAEAKRRAESLRKRLPDRK